MSKIAAVQMASGPLYRANLTEAGRLIAMAVAGGARLVALPENFALMPIEEGDRLALAEDDGRGPIQEFLAHQARTHGIWLVGGTIPLKARQPGKVRATCLVYNERGERVARYDKIHLFDVELENVDAHDSRDGGGRAASGTAAEGRTSVAGDRMSGATERYRESATTEAGDSPVVFETPCGRVGLAVCYDLRFPELFRRLLDQGAELFVVPSAFTARTGRAHWETLVRARAIENLAYLIAPAQGGYHLNGRETHGDSMIVSPWGEVLDRLPRGSGVVSAECDLQQLQRIRRSFPSIRHRRLS
ncbi:MAG: carbon-nitrogen hydrolase family protein [Gammaproteobacteria bacterium]|nr:carbon-nitrogen hydrolase family protein [Gammaproteobacteria bacterium]